jgi:hypothetical protein
MQKKQIKNTILLFIVFGLLIIIALNIYMKVEWKEFTTIFNNLSTPIITAIALIIYYLSLVQMRKQTDSLNEEKKILHGENIYKDFLLKIQEIKDSVLKKDLGTLLPKDIEKSSFNVLSIYTGSIIEIVRKLKADKQYNKFLEKENFEKATKDEIFNFSFNKYYVALNSINHYLSEFLYKVNFILFQINENESLHDSHKNLLFKYIAKEVLCDYFLLVLNKDHFVYTVIPPKIKGQDLNYKTSFESFDLELVYNFYKKNFPEIIEEVLFLKR